MSYVMKLRKERMKTDLKPILAALLASGGEIRIKSKHNESTFCIESHTIESYEELSFNPRPYEGICVMGETRESKEARLVREAMIALEKRDFL